LETKRVELLDKAKELHVNDRVLFLVQNTRYVGWAEHIGAMEGEQRAHISHQAQDTNESQEKSFLSAFPRCKVSGHCRLKLLSYSRYQLQFGSSSYVNAQNSIFYHKTFIKMKDHKMYGLCDTDPPEIGLKTIERTLEGLSVPGLTVKDLLIYSALCAGILEYTSEYKEDRGDIEQNWEKTEKDLGVLKVTDTKTSQDQLKWWQTEQTPFLGFVLSRTLVSMRIAQRYEEQKLELSNLFRSFNWNYYYSYLLCPDKAGGECSMILQKETGPAHVGIWERKDAEHEDKKEEEQAKQQAALAREELSESEVLYYESHAKCRRCASGMSRMCSMKGNEVVKIV